MAIEQYPRKSVARPHTEINVDTSGIGGSSSGSEKILMLVGSAKGGKPNEVYRVRNYPQAKSIFRSGDLLDAIELAWNPSPDVPGAGDILAMRVDDAKNSSLTKGALKFTSELYGTESNEIQVALEDNELTHTKRLRLVFSKDRYNKVFDNLGKIFSINYTGEEEAATFTIEEDSVTKNANKLILKAGTSGALVTVREYELGSGAFTDANVLISDINNLPDFEAKFFPIGDKNVPTATFEKEADIDIKNKKDAYVKALGGDIEKQLKYNGYVTVEIDRTKVITAFALTKLAGGEDGLVPESWANKFSALANEGGYYLVPLTAKPAVHAEALAFVRDRSDNADPMRIFVGGGVNESLEELTSRATSLQNARAGLVGFSGTRSMDDGRIMKLPAYMLAAQVAGLTCGLEIGGASTFKHILLDAVDSVYEGAQLDQLNQSGVIMAEYVRNRSVTYFRIVQDVTTFNDKTDPVKNEISVGEANDFLCSELKIKMDDNFIGTKVIQTSSPLVKNFIQSFLDEKVRAREIQGYEPEEVQVIIDGDVATISMTVYPIRSLNKIVIGLVYRQQILTA